MKTAMRHRNGKSLEHLVSQIAALPTGAMIVVVYFSGKRLFHVDELADIVPRKVEVHYITNSRTHSILNSILGRKNRKQVRRMDAITVFGSISQKLRRGGAPLRVSSQKVGAWKKNERIDRLGSLIKSAKPNLKHKLNEKDRYELEHPEIYTEYKRKKSRKKKKKRRSRSAYFYTGKTSAWVLVETPWKKNSSPPSTKNWLDSPRKPKVILRKASNR